MATSTYLSNPVVLIGASAMATTDITDQVSAVTVNFTLSKHLKTPRLARLHAPTPQACNQTAQRSLCTRRMRRQKVMQHCQHLLAQNALSV
jgi:hypothetical protein